MLGEGMAGGPPLASPMVGPPAGAAVPIAPMPGILRDPAPAVAAPSSRIK
jgi:hypothetical protein